jgi:hypothetical protein
MTECKHIYSIHKQISINEKIKKYKTLCFRCLDEQELVIPYGCLIKFEDKKFNDENLVLFPLEEIENDFKTIENSKSITETGKH